MQQLFNKVQTMAIGPSSIFSWSTYSNENCTKWQGFQGNKHHSQQACGIYVLECDAETEATTRHITDLD